ncbi:MAG TPA: hypothetical protein VGL35_15135 [Rhizomicrobium sp.]
MKRLFAVGAALSFLVATDMASAETAGKPPQPAPSVANVAPAAQAVRPVHAVLRYDATTAAACRSFSDASSEVCLLLALHVIRLSEKSLAGGAL